MSADPRTKSSADLQIEVQSWLEENWSPECKKDIPGWFGKVVDAGYAVPTWSNQWFGQNLDVASAKIIDREFARVKAPGACQDSKNMGAMTAYHSGSDDLRKELLHDLLTGARTCMLYSEPGAGSDLAGLRTKADFAGDEFIINGQKVWTSGATIAKYGMLLARTDWDVPKHEGLTFFILPMDQPGIEVRPINQINGDSTFNEVFITNARVPAYYIVGELNRGWQVLQTALAHERLVMGQGATEKKQTKGKDSAQELINLAKTNGKLDNPVLRQKMAQTIAYRQLHRLNVKRAKEDLATNGSSSLMSIGKLSMSRVQHSEAALRADILAASGLHDGENFPEAKQSHYYAASGYVNSIGGGTDQIQRNIISERILGLPREIEVDRKIPFRELKTGW